MKKKTDKPTVTKKKQSPDSKNPATQPGEEVEETPNAKPFPIVAIGASAGGLEALTDLLKNLSPSTGMAFVYIQHLSPDHESLLSTILTKATTMNVVEAMDKMAILPNYLYVIPPNKEMFIEESLLRLNPRPARPVISMPINLFFFSLAENQKKGAIGIVLSGNASDGSLGLKAIKSAGGFTFAQDNSAKFNSMPRAAIAEGAVDMVLPPQKIAQQLERLSKHPSLLHAIMDEEVEMSSATANDIPQILNLLRLTHFVDFTNYKPSTIQRRIIRRMLLHHMQSLGEYYKYLLDNKDEITVLYNDLLINVTDFFRDSETMSFLEKVVLPQVVKNKKDADIRIWVPACSTGQEAYSIAMLLLEMVGDTSTIPRIKIFATDLSESAIHKARIGKYSLTDLANVSDTRRNRFFTNTDSSYRIVRSIRDLCVFATHNVLTDPPFLNVDLISCCNLLIYLDTVLQKRVISTFHYALNPGGFLVLGKSESIGSDSLSFTQMEKGIQAYVTKKDGTPRSNVGTVSRIITLDDHMHSFKPPVRRNDPPTLNKIVDTILLSRFAPASVVINKEMDILQFRGSTGLYLEPAPGKASLNLLKMARPGLNLELRNAVNKVIQTGENVLKTGIEISHEQTAHFVNIEVLPVTHDEAPMYLVIFQKMPVLSMDGSRQTVHNANDQRIMHLESELLSAREDLRTMIEHQEDINEVLQNANEEALSANEELQSFNEELETSKEEIESANEELMTMNAELIMRNDQLNESYDYADAVLTTLREALVVLDKDLRVINANKTFYKIFKTNEEHTIKVLFYELADGQWNLPALRLQLQSIIQENTHFENYEVELNFPQVGNKVLVLNGRKLLQKYSKQEMILLAIEDNTEHVLAQRLLREREEWIRNIADNAPVMMWTSDKEGNRNFFNQTWREFTGHEPEDVIGLQWQESINPVDRDSFLKRYNEAVKKQIPFEAEYRLRRADGKYRWVLSYAKPMFSPGGFFEGYIGTITEIHNQRTLNEELEKRVQERTEQLEKTNNSLQQFAFISSHDLQEPARKIMTFINFIRNKELSQTQANTYLDKIYDASERMTALIRSILEYSQIPTSETPLEEVDLNTILMQVLSDLELQIQEKAVTINSDKLPAIRGNEFQLTLLFNNLISNSIKFSNESPTILIKAKNVTGNMVKTNSMVDPKINFVQLSFRDNGIGFDPAYKNKIFDLFQRLHGKSSYAGTGIGLSIVHKIVEQHHGYIDATGEPGKGAEFTVWLPA